MRASNMEGRTGGGRVLVVLVAAWCCLTTCDTKGIFLISPSCGTMRQVERLSVPAGGGWLYTPSVPAAGDRLFTSTLQIISDDAVCHVPAHATLKVSISENKSLFNVEEASSGETVCILNTNDELQLNTGKAKFSCSKSIEDDLRAELEDTEVMAGIPGESAHRQAEAGVVSVRSEREKRARRKEKRVKVTSPPSLPSAPSGHVVASVAAENVTHEATIRKTAKTTTSITTYKASTTKIITTVFPPTLPSSTPPTLPSSTPPTLPSSTPPTLPPPTPTLPPPTPPPTTLPPPTMPLLPSSPPPTTIQSESTASTSVVSTSTISASTMTSTMPVATTTPATATITALFTTTIPTTLTSSTNNILATTTTPLSTAVLTTRPDTSPNLLKWSKTSPDLATWPPTSPDLATWSKTSPDLATWPPTSSDLATWPPTSPDLVTWPPTSPDLTTWSSTSPDLATWPPSPNLATRPPTSPNLPTWPPTSPNVATWPPTSTKLTPQPSSFPHYIYIITSLGVVLSLVTVASTYYRCRQAKPANQRQDVMALEASFISRNSVTAVPIATTETSSSMPWKGVPPQSLGFGNEVKEDSSGDHLVFLGTVSRVNLMEEELESLPPPLLTTFQI